MLRNSNGVHDAQLDFPVEGRAASVGVILHGNVVDHAFAVEVDRNLVSTDDDVKHLLLPTGLSATLDGLPGFRLLPYSPPDHGSSQMHLGQPARIDARSPAPLIFQSTKELKSP